MSGVAGAGEPARSRSGRAGAGSIVPNRGRRTGGLVIVGASYDAKTDLWSARSDELGGVFLHATSWKVLVDTVPEAVDRLLPRGLFGGAHDIAIEVTGPMRAAIQPWREPLESIHSRA